MMFCFEMLRRVTHCGVFLHFGGDLKLLQHMLVPAEKPAPQEASRHVATWTWQIVPSINPFPKSCQVFFRRFRQVWSIRGGDWLFKGFERSPANSLDSLSMQGLPWRRKKLMSRPKVSTLPKKSSSERRSRDSQFSLGLEFPQLGFLNGAVFTCTWGILWMLG